MLILVWFIVCIIFPFVNFIIGDSGHALELFETTNSIEIGDLLVFENFISDFKLVPVPDINTAVLILL